MTRMAGIAMPDVKLPRSPLYAFFALPRGRLLKVHAEPCMYAPGYLQSNKPRWPRDTPAGVGVEGGTSNG